MFRNTAVRQPKPDKPHIQFMSGFWRVSPANRLFAIWEGEHKTRKAYELCGKANRFAQMMNMQPDQIGWPDIPRIQGRSWTSDNT